MNHCAMAPISDRLEEPPNRWLDLRNAYMYRTLCTFNSSTIHICWRFLVDDPGSLVALKPRGSKHHYLYDSFFFGWDLVRFQIL